MESSKLDLVIEIGGLVLGLVSAVGATIAATPVVTRWWRDRLSESEEAILFLANDPNRQSVTIFKKSHPAGGLVLSLHPAQYLCISQRDCSKLESLGYLARMDNWSSMELPRHTDTLSGTYRVGARFEVTPSGRIRAGKICFQKMSAYISVHQIHILPAEV